VPVGVNRTWVKQVEKGVFPHSRRLFSVMRCNHCTDAPCVEICPVEALFVREDGIVDFNKDRCIGCKSCMQACPYDALYIDPDTNTAAKCNYCAHRVDIGLEPACVNVCPEHAIISGDMENPNSEIAQLLSRQQVSVRKAEKATSPNLFYIDADESSLNPSATESVNQNIWGSQALGVGHYAKEAEKLAFSNSDVIQMIKESKEVEESKSGYKAKNIDVILGKARQTYNSPNKGILWGWEVSAYVFTKAMATGAFLVPFIAWALGAFELGEKSWLIGLILGLFFMGATGLLLVKDLDRPDRFLNVLLRPQWKSWLVKGGYAISIFGALLSLLLVNQLFNWSLPKEILYWLTAATAVVVSVYTAFLFAQAKGRDFWQSPGLALHMLIHSVLAGAAVFGVLQLFVFEGADWTSFLSRILLIAISFNLLTMLFELSITHPTKDAKRVVDMIVRGRYKNLFWVGVIIFGNVLPIIALIFGGGEMNLAITGIFILIGIYITEHIWVESPQQISLS
jgi:Fe-S-cluster-containing dehydrogenase component/formate-dependent nitrite reductase membrane component NrfD